MAVPTLFHPDINKRNIYVSKEDPSIVTGIIDWQSTSIEPGFVYANETPDFVEDPAADVPILEKMMADGDDPDGELQLSPEEEATRKKHLEDVDRCRQTYEVVFMGKMRRIHDARVLDQTLLRPIRFCDASWRDSAAAFRQELIDLSKRWTELGMSGPCPYQPTEDELAEHAKQYEDLETVQSLKMFLKRALDADSDGWVPAENYETAKKEHAQLFKDFVESVVENGGTEERARQLWPFSDHRDV